jgi:hypothetical protein
MEDSSQRVLHRTMVGDGPAGWAQPRSVARPVRALREELTSYSSFAMAGNVVQGLDHCSWVGEPVAGEVSCVVYEVEC